MIINRLFEARSIKARIEELLKDPTNTPEQNTKLRTMLDDAQAIIREEELKNTSALK